MIGSALKVAGTCLALLSLAGCGADRAPVPAPATRPVKIFVVEGVGGRTSRTFPGRVEATKRAELAFRVAGRLQQILVKEGNRVREGQVLARLDPTDFEIVLEERQASYDRAERNFKRGLELVEDGNISRIDYDTMETNYRAASAALSQARRDLDSTVMVAPFDGRIARREVENYEEVMAKQTIFTLQSTDQLDIIIDLPESVVLGIRGSARGEEPQSRARAYARFEGHGDQTFPLTHKEIATKADEQTQTYRATLTMDAPTDFNVLPGMSATVVVDLSALGGEEAVKWVPVRAVQGDSGLEPRVWVLDPEHMTVHARGVTLGRMSGRMVQVTEGLEGGEEIVAVGADYLAEGMRVTRMAATEQAVPRDDEPS
jgi:RND family efflux transporter MFP subunit